MKYLLPIALSMILFNCDNSQPQHEIQNPTSYLTVKNEPWAMNEKIIKGTLTNSATKADYSNIVILVHYFSNAGDKLGTERVNEYDILKAGASRNYHADIHPPALTDKINLTIERASYVDYTEKSKY